MEKRYQVFVSSTFTDLEEERKEVIQALLELDCFPSGMELFPAADESQWEFIKKVIDDCDYYILILGGRYGSTGPDGLSYTEMEYRYAIEIGKPTIAFLHKNPENIVASKTESSDDGREKLREFRALVGSKLCKYWSDGSDLGAVVSRSMTQLIKRSPAIGWVRANEIADADATKELLRLRQRVEELEQELSHAHTLITSKNSTELAGGDEEISIPIGYQTINSSVRKETRISMTWIDILFVIGVKLMNSYSYEVEMKERLIYYLYFNYNEYFDEDFECSVDLSTVNIQGYYFEYIIYGLRKMNCVECRIDKYFFTEYGESVYVECLKENGLLPNKVENN